MEQRSVRPRKRRTRGRPKVGSAESISNRKDQEIKEKYKKIAVSLSKNYCVEEWQKLKSCASRTDEELVTHLLDVHRQYDCECFSQVQRRRNTEGVVSDSQNPETNGEGIGDEESVLEVSQVCTVSAIPNSVNSSDSSSNIRRYNLHHSVCSVEVIASKDDVDYWLTCNANRLSFKPTRSSRAYFTLFVYNFTNFNGIPPTYTPVVLVPAEKSKAVEATDEDDIRLSDFVRGDYEGMNIPEDAKFLKLRAVGSVYSIQSSQTENFINVGEQRGQGENGKERRVVMSSVKGRIKVTAV